MAWLPLYPRARLPVRQREPATQMLCGFVRGLAVERHQGHGTTWDTRDLRTPFAKADAGYLNVVFTAVDDLFETMHVWPSAGAMLTLRPTRDSSGWAGPFKRKEKRRRINTVQRPCFAPGYFEKTSRFFSSAQALHLASTAFQQRAGSEREFEVDPGRSVHYAGILPCFSEATSS